MADGHLYRKGQSGNPGGRPRAAALAIAKKFRVATDDGDEVRQFVIDVMRGKLRGVDDAKSRRWACDVVLDRGWGKPQQFIEITNGEGAPKVDYSVLTDDELAELERITAKLELSAAQVEPGQVEPGSGGPISGGSGVGGSAIH